MSDAIVTRLREEIAACTRLLVMHGIMDFSGHVSARIPGTERILLQPKDTSRLALKADDLLVIDLSGHVLEGQGRPPLETSLHTCMYRARPDIQAVCHGHPSVSTLFSVVERPWMAVRNFAYRFTEVPVHPDTTHIRTEEQGRAVAAALGKQSICLLRAHGTVAVSVSIQQLFMDCLDFEENARSLLYAGSLGQVLPLNREEVDALRASYGRGDSRAAKVWEHCLQRARLTGVL